MFMFPLTPLELMDTYQCQQIAGMFVRLKTVRSYHYLQLVESVRESNKPRQRVLATLGRVEELQVNGSIDALVSSLSKFSRNALALIAGQSTPDTHALTIGPVLIFQRLWQRLELDQMLAVGQKGPGRVGSGPF